MFVGEYRHNMDTKGRLAIPFRMRSELEHGAIVTRGVDTCLTIYTRAEWDTLAAKIAALPMSDPKARRFSRFFLAGAAEVEFDKQGRILLPAYLREYAGITGEVVVAGVYNRIELWSEQSWDKQATEVSPADDLGGLEI
jgi:MraZ protein